MKKQGCPLGTVRIGGVCVPSHCKEFMDYFGETLDYENTGFISPDGRYILNACETHTDMINEFDNHNNLPKGYEGLNKYEKLSRLMDKCHFIRFIFDSVKKEGQWGGGMSIESINKPTVNQIEALTHPFYENPIIELIAERTKDMKSVCSIAPVIPKVIDIQKFSSRCWK